MTQALRQLGILALGTRLRVISEKMMATVKAFYEDNGLTFEPRWFPLYRTIKSNPGIGIMELAQAIGVSHAAINALCNQLVAEGLIDVAADPDDGRAKKISLTDAGLVLFTRLEPAWFVLESALLSVFPEEQSQQVLSSLTLLEDSLADSGLQRSLKSALQPSSLLQDLEILPFSPSEPDHTRFFAALNIEWLEHYFSVEPTDRHMFSDPYGEIIAKGGCIYMALIRGQIVGTCALIKRSDEVYEMAKMAVSKLFQGKGIGTRLILAILEHARGLGLKKLYLVSSKRLPHAVPTYRKLGFIDSPLGLHDLYDRSDITLEMDLAEKSG